jgi:hypothetical protein
MGQLGEGEALGFSVFSGQFRNSEIIGEKIGRKLEEW